MDLRKLKTILELFENSRVSELEISEGEDRVRLSRGVAEISPESAPPRAVLPSASSPPSAGGFVADDGGGEAAEAEQGTVVKSPMVGTFYRAASPDRPPFVSEGKRVEKGETLCIIEAMKLMNELPSPVSGVVRRVIAGNGEPVGFGDSLFVIE